MLRNQDIVNTVKKTNRDIETRLLQNNVYSHENHTWCVYRSMSVTCPLLLISSMPPRNVAEKLALDRKKIYVEIDKRIQNKIGITQYLPCSALWPDTDNS